MAHLLPELAKWVADWIFEQIAQQLNPGKDVVRQNTSVITGPYHCDVVCHS